MEYPVASHFVTIGNLIPIDSPSAVPYGAGPTMMAPWQAPARARDEQYDARRQDFAGRFRVPGYDWDHCGRVGALPDERVTVLLTILLTTLLTTPDATPERALPRPRACRS